MYDDAEDQEIMARRGWSKFGLFWRRFTTGALIIVVVLTGIVLVLRAR